MEAMMFCNFILEATHHHVHHVLLEDSPCTEARPWGADARGRSARGFGGEGRQGASWRLATISAPSPYLLPRDTRYLQSPETRSRKGRPLYHLENEAKGGRSCQNRTGKPVYPVSMPLTQRTARDKPQPCQASMAPLDSEGQLAQRSPPGGPRITGL